MKEKKSSVQYIEITENFISQRIDNFLLTRLKGVPKTRIYRLLRKGEVRVNKKRIPPSYRLQSGDQVRVPPVRLPTQLPLPKPGRQMMQLLAERILYEDKGLLILNKPSGIPVHGGSRVKLGIIEILREMYPKIPHLELAHRLDADTSGCLVLAKKRSILKELHELLRARGFRKIYLALTQGHWKPQELTVDAPLQKNILQSGERMVKVHPEGKPSLTIFKTIQVFKQATLVQADLQTGRTHQIRVHAHYRRHPIAGDEKYGDDIFNKTLRQIGLKRLFLHSQSVEFPLASTGQLIKITAPLDEELQSCLDKLE